MIDKSDNGHDDIALGPQCLSCRKRRVKCSSEKDFCHRCGRDGIKCPGYEKQLKIVPFRPTKHSRSTRRQHDVQIAPKPIDTKPIATIPTPILLPQDPDEFAIHDSIHCYNTYVVPMATPLHAPFHRQPADALITHAILPKIIQHTFIVTTRSLQAARNGLDPKLRQEICHYRGLCLRELKDFLPTAATDPWGIALGSILMLIGADMHASGSGDGAWVMHFEAARRVIRMRGGFEVCLNQLPFMKAPLANWLVVDVLSSTMCKSRDLFKDHNGARDHAVYLHLLPNLEGDLLANACACPVEVLMIIVQIDLLRSSVNKPTLQDSSTQFSDILQSIRAFDPRTWALRVLQLGKVLPLRARDCPSSNDISAFTSLALCYKFAALIYLVLSNSCLSSVHLFEDVESAKRMIDKNIDMLFAQRGHDNDGPLHQQLWKFVTWPLVVSVYARSGWNIGETNGTLSIDKELDRFMDRAFMLRSKRMLDAAKHMRDIHIRRSAVNEMYWTWDDGFESRCAFI